MNFSYHNYVTRYKYQPYTWPPDLGLSQLHARCSEPGAANIDGVQCPCCQEWSKKRVYKWWKRSIDKDLNTLGCGTAIPGYFQLIKYYSFFALLVLLINSIYPIYATYYACNELDLQNNICLQVGALYYLEFNDLIDILEDNRQNEMISVIVIIFQTLMALQTSVFYILLFANFFSIIYITFLNESAKREFAELKSSEASRCLVFYNIPKNVAQNLTELLKNESDDSMHIIKSMELYQIKNYYQNFTKRNKIYYNLLSLYVQAENPLKVKNINKQLQTYHRQVLQQKQKFKLFSGRVVVLFENVESRRLVHSIYHVGFWKKWYYGFRTLLGEFGIYKFDNSTINLCTYEIGMGSDVMWQNLGEQFGVKMATRIKTFFVAVVFIFICYIVLYYPMIFSLKTHIKVETERFVRLNTFEKILPNLTSFALVGISIFFRNYMDKLSEQRNPKDELEKSRFLLITCLTFHLLFYVIIPTAFFMIPGQISQTVKLYVISEQARTFVVVQVVMVLVDLPYRMWKNKKIQALSDQRIAFRNNQKMLHELVECKDYPLQTKLQVLFRIWSLVLLYSFFIPYMIFYILIAFFIIFWIEKRNLYRHYTIKRKVSIRLESQTLIYYVNFFCMYLCFIYCHTMINHPIKIAIAILITLVGIIGNVVYWIFMNKASQNINQQILLKSTMELTADVALLKRQKLTGEAENFVNAYHSFLDEIQNDKLDEQITDYLNEYKKYTNLRESQRRSQLIELQSLNLQNYARLKEQKDNEEKDEDEERQEMAEEFNQ